MRIISLWWPYAHHRTMDKVTADLTWQCLFSLMTLNLQAHMHGRFWNMDIWIRNWIIVKNTLMKHVLSHTKWPSLYNFNYQCTFMFYNIGITMDLQMCCFMKLSNCIPAFLISNSGHLFVLIMLIGEYGNYLYLDKCKRIFIMKIYIVNFNDVLRLQRQWTPGIY
jgi:hypothetical protein